VHWRDAPIVKPWQTVDRQITLVSKSSDAPSIVTQDTRQASCLGHLEVPRLAAGGQATVRGWAWRLSSGGQLAPGRRRAAAAELVAVRPAGSGHSHGWSAAEE
jgi:hypothetical protein